MSRRVFVLVLCLSSFCFRSCIPLYATVCDRVVSFVSYRLKCGGMMRSMSSIMSFLLDFLAMASAFLLPRLPLWPFTHIKVVGADLTLSW